MSSKDPFSFLLRIAVEVGSCSQKLLHVSANRLRLSFLLKLAFRDLNTSGLVAAMVQRLGLEIQWCFCLFHLGQTRSKCLGNKVTEFQVLSLKMLSKRELFHFGDMGDFKGDLFMLFQFSSFL